MKGNAWTCAVTFLTVLICGEAAATSSPQVDLGYSIQEGTLDTSGSDPIYKFSNIRYAQPPVGDLRFAAPVAPFGRNTTVNNDQSPVACPGAQVAWQANQSAFMKAYLAGDDVSDFENDPPASPKTQVYPGPADDVSEDCLLLDVFVPQTIFDSANSQLFRRESPDELAVEIMGRVFGKVQGAPVLIWLYGGGYITGSKTAFPDPSGLLSRGLENDNEGFIWVAMNYRLGMFGFLSGSPDVTANAGLLDQRLAMEWVQRYIPLFGGDPSRVTILGESAGGGSVLHHITAQAGEGSVPFQQAIVQSPAFNPTVPTQSTAFFQDVLGNASSMAGKQISNVADLRALDFATLYQINYDVVARSLYGGFTFGPVVDTSFNSYVPDLPLRLLSKGTYHNITALIGHNTMEGLLFTPPFVQSQPDFHNFMSLVYPTANSSSLDAIANTLYPPTYDGSMGYTDPITRFITAAADYTIACNAHALAATLPAYAYLFALPPGVHGEDVPYTFFHDQNGIDPNLAKPFQRYLANFVMNGAPVSEGFPAMSLYGEGDMVAVINRTDFGHHAKDPADKRRCEWWAEAPYYTS